MHEKKWNIVILILYYHKVSECLDFGFYIKSATENQNNVLLLIFCKLECEIVYHMW